MPIRWLSSLRSLSRVCLWISDAIRKLNSSSIFAVVNGNLAWCRRWQVLIENNVGGTNQMRAELLLRRGDSLSMRISPTRLPRCAAIAAALVGASFASQAISFAQMRPSFEVVSVKPAAPNDAPWSLSLPNWRLFASNIPIRSLIGYAYSARDHQVVGGPAWVGSERYNVEAVPEKDFVPPAGSPSPANDAPIRLMVRSLLEERCKLLLHRETREQPIYELLVAKSGSKLKPTSDPDRLARNPGMFGSRGISRGESVPISMLSATLERALGRSVVDKTGLTGRYDFELRWMPDSGSSGNSDSDGPSLFTAVREQLGLQLKSGRGPVEVYVIDRVQKPDAN